MAENTEQKQEPKRLTPDDPIAPEIREKFDELDKATHDIAVQLLAIEESKIRLLTASHQINQERDRWFERVLMERGLPLGTTVEIDYDTGKIKVLNLPKKPPEEPK